MIELKKSGLIPLCTNVYTPKLYNTEAVGRKQIKFQLPFQFQVF